MQVTNQNNVDDGGLKQLVLSKTNNIGDTKYNV